jgi:NAD(P)-dependent dehydrogenase (short-subunit alcohol dehydrogenase family)
LGKVATITGAASGIGRAVALAFAAEGAKVVAADINADGLAEIESDSIAVITTDVTRDAEVRRMVDFCVERFGRMDILFNNAGLGLRTRIEDLPDGEFEQLVAVHLFGGLYGVRAGLRQMRAQGYGRIVNVVSRGAEAESPSWAAYGAAKAGLFALTRVAASECADVDILVNAMIPGPTRTAMNRGPNLQAPEAVVPSALWLATLPAGGPTGKVFWNKTEYRLFERTGS